MTVYPGVSRETAARLESFAALVRTWSPTINLVSPATLVDLERRHILDSLQVLALVDQKRGHWVDLGTGGGFPGLVCCIAAAERAPDLRFTFVESDRRKAAFLVTTLAKLDLSAEVEARRIEALPPLDADILTARALAPLPVLLGHAERHLRADGYAIFPKGARHAAEIDAARASWRFTCTVVQSTTDPSGALLKIGDIARA